MNPVVYLNYNDISLWIDSLQPEFKQYPFVAIVGILRGGGFPALCASFATGLPLYHVKYDRQTQTAKWDGEIPPQGLVLVCEDFAGSGQTLSNCLRLINQTHEYKTLTLVSDEKSRIEADWTKRYDGYQVVLPWERHCLSPAHHEDWTNNGGKLGLTKMNNDNEYRYYAVDLDGIFCVDIHPIEYETDLHTTLQTRDQLPILPTAPTLKEGKHIIVTGRPTEDTQRTKEWMEKHGYHSIDIHHRNPEKHSAKETAIHKGEVATKLGCSDFIESCPQQALEIAINFPHLRVTYWNNGNPILISASQLSM